MSEKKLIELHLHPEWLSASGDRMGVIEGAGDRHSGFLSRGRKV